MNDPSNNNPNPFPFYKFLKLQLKAELFNHTLRQLSENIEIVRDCTTESISILESMIEMPAELRERKMLELLDLLETKMKALDNIQEEIDDFQISDVDEKNQSSGIEDDEM